MLKQWSESREGRSCTLQTCEQNRAEIKPLQSSQHSGYCGMLRALRREFRTAWVKVRSPGAGIDIIPLHPRLEWIVMPHSLPRGCSGGNAGPADRRRGPRRCAAGGSRMLVAVIMGGSKSGTPRIVLTAAFETQEPFITHRRLLAWERGGVIGQERNRGGSELVALVSWASVW